MTIFRKIGPILGITLLILVLPGTVHILVHGHVSRWFVVFQLIVAVVFLVSGLTALAISAVVRDRHRR